MQAKEILNIDVLKKKFHIAKIFYNIHVISLDDTWWYHDMIPRKKLPIHHETPTFFGYLSYHIFKNRLLKLTTIFYYSKLAINREKWITASSASEQDTPSIPNYLTLLTRTRILRNVWRIYKNAQLGLDSILNKLSNELFYTQNEATSQKIWWFDQPVV
jgi:hypothetical protein